MKAVAIIGLGYVGLPLACLCAEKGIDVYGVDTDKTRADLINRGISPIGDPELKASLKRAKGRIRVVSPEDAIKNSEAVIVCVPTPVDENHLPDLTALKRACEIIAKSLRNDILVVIESTIFPGTVEEICLPILKKSDAKIYLAHCPERIDPGNKKFTIKNIPRVIAGIDRESTKKAAEFYRKIIDANILELSSVKAAEATKIMENTFRDVNIAFVNEMAKSFDKAGIDVTEVIKGASTKPFSFMPHYPGVGVGGHCFDGNEWIFVKHDDSVHPVKIGELYELIKYYNETEIGALHLASPGSLEVLSFDLESKKSCYKRINLMSKRAYSRMLNIKSSCGYSIKVTDKHPVVIFDSNFKVKCANELGKDDRMVVSLELLNIEKIDNSIKENFSQNAQITIMKQNTVLSSIIETIKKIITYPDVQIFDTFATVKISDIEEAAGDYVYSLEVEDTGTVVTTNGLVMHNCIAVDPYYLISKARQIGFNHDFLILARKINESMPNYTVSLLENELKKLNKGVKGAKVGILGLAYKANVDDVRESPSFEVIRILKEKGAEVFIFDPHVKNGSNVKDIDELLKKSDYIILATAHNEFKNLDLNKLKENGIKAVIDGRNCWDKEKIKAMGILYHGIGRG